MDDMGRHAEHQARGGKAYHAILAGSIAACAILSGTSIVLTSQVIGRMGDVAAAVAKADPDDGKASNVPDYVVTRSSDGDHAPSDAGPGSLQDDGPAATQSTNEEKNKTNSNQPDAEASGKDDGDVAAKGGEDGDGAEASADGGIGEGPAGEVEGAAAAAAPSAAPATPGQAAPSIWHVRAGDTLSGISDATGASVDAIATANGIRDVDLIYAGSALVIPA